jgi:hypothetical protein
MVRNFIADHMLHTHSGKWHLFVAAGRQRRSTSAVLTLCRCLVLCAVPLRNPSRRSRTPAAVLGGPLSRLLATLEAVSPVLWLLRIYWCLGAQPLCQTLAGKEHAL